MSTRVLNVLEYLDVNKGKIGFLLTSNRIYSSLIDFPVIIITVENHEGGFYSSV